MASTRKCGFRKHNISHVYEGEFALVQCPKACENLLRTTGLGNGIYFILIIKTTPLYNENSPIRVPFTKMGVAMPKGMCKLLEWGASNVYVLALDNTKR